MLLNNLTASQPPPIPKRSPTAQQPTRVRKLGCQILFAGVGPILETRLSDGS
jgi:hypothetical protein